MASELYLSTFHSRRRELEQQARDYRRARIARQARRARRGRA